MCNNCQYKGIAITLPPNLAAENEELKKQIAALTEALETQNRENQPYIKDLEEKRDFYKENYEYMQGRYSLVTVTLRKATQLLDRVNNIRLPEGLQEEIELFLSTDKP